MFIPTREIEFNGIKYIVNCDDRFDDLVIQISHGDFYTNIKIIKSTMEVEYYDFSNLTVDNLYASTVVMREVLCEMKVL